MQLFSNLHVKASEVNVTACVYNVVNCVFFTTFTVQCLRHNTSTSFNHICPV